MGRWGGGCRSTATSCNTVDAPVNSISSPPVTIPAFSPLDRCFPIYSHVIGFRKSLPPTPHSIFFYASFYASSGDRWCVPVWTCSNILPEGSSEVFGTLTRLLIRPPYTQNLRAVRLVRIFMKFCIRNFLREFVPLVSFSI